MIFYLFAVFMHICDTLTVRSAHQRSINIKNAFRTHAERSVEPYTVYMCVRPYYGCTLSLNNAFVARSYKPHVTSVEHTTRTSLTYVGVVVVDLGIFTDMSRARVIFIFTSPRESRDCVSVRHATCHDVGRVMGRLPTELFS